MLDEPENILQQLAPTDRQRGGRAFVEKRSGAYYGKLGYRSGLGWSSEKIAEATGDGIHPSYVRTLWRRWDFDTYQTRCTVPLTDSQRCTLAWRAEKAGMTPEKWLANIVTDAISGSTAIGGSAAI